MNESLSPAKKDLRVVRITGSDARRNTDDLQTLGRLIAANEAMYPGIESWFARKVVPGLKAGSRVGFVGYSNELPIITAVVKRGVHAKFCHLRIAEDFQDFHLGEIFFSLMALEVRGAAEEIHFTLPESLWFGKNQFFAGFGFREVKASASQYRNSEEELRCSASFASVWWNVLEKLPKLMRQFSVNEHSMCPQVLLSVKPEYADKILGGDKTIEVRRRFHSKWKGGRIALYSSSPARSLVGEATIKDVQVGSPSDIWDRYGSGIACSEAEYSSYTRACSDVYAIHLGDVTPYLARVPLAQVKAWIEADLAPPQSHCKLEVDRSWTKAVSVAALLHGSVKGALRGSLRAGSPL